MFYDKYLEALGITGIPNQYTRWAMVSAVAASLGRRVYFPFGNDNIYPSMYIIFIDRPGTSKSRAIKLAQTQLEQAGYAQFSADKTSPTQFLMDLANPMTAIPETDFDEIIVGGDVDHGECFVCQGELSAFLGQKEYAFLEILTSLWDNHKDTFTGSYRTLKSFKVVKPVVNILGGTNPDKIEHVLGENAIGGGLLSRFVVVNAPEIKARKLWPQRGSESASADLLEEFKRIMLMEGEFTITDTAKELAIELWNNTPDMPDRRFAYYVSRRMDQLWKVAMNIAAQEDTMTLTEDIIKWANTLLYATEIRMPYGLGEFGRSKRAPMYQLILEQLGTSDEPLTPQVLYKKLATDIDKGYEELLALLGSLVQANKIQMIKLRGGIAYTTHISAETEWNPEFLALDYLTPSESPDAVKGEDVHKAIEF